MAINWGGIAQGAGLLLQAYQAREADKAALSLEDQIRLAQLNMPDTRNPFRYQNVTFDESGRPSIEWGYTPAMEGIVNGLLAEAGGVPDEYRIGGGLQAINRMGENYQLERYGLPPNFGGGSGMYGGTSPGYAGGSPGIGSGGGDSDLEDTPDYGSTPESRAGGVSNPDGSRYMPGYPTGGGPGGGVNVGYGGLGGLPWGGAGGGGGFSFGDMWSNRPDELQAIMNNDFVGGIIGALTGLPGVAWGIDQLNGMYPSGQMHPGSAGYVPGVNDPMNPSSPDFVGPPDNGGSYQMPDWMGAYNNPYQPNYSNTGRDRNRNAPGNQTGTNGGLNAYNRTIWQNPRDGSPINEGFWEAAEIQDPNPYLRRR